MDSITIGQRKAYDLASNGNYVNASNVLEVLVNNEPDIKLKGYLKQGFAEYVNLYNKPKAQKIQMSAASDNRRVLKPIEGIQYHKISSDMVDQAISCSNFMVSRYQDPNKLVIEIDAIIEDLQFKENSSNVFEEGLKNIAEYLGFDSQRPEQEYKKGQMFYGKLVI